MPGFADIIRNVALPLADSLTDSLQPSIQHYAWTGQIGNGIPTYAPALSGAGTLVKCLVDYRREYKQDSNGAMVLTKAYLFFPRPFVVDPKDVIKLPNGEIGKIVPVAGLVDKDTGQSFYKEVWLQ